MGWLDYAGWIVGVVGGLSGLGAVVARFTTDKDAEAARLWREYAEAQAATAEMLETRVNALASRVERLEAENAILRSLASGEAAVASLTRTVTDQHEAVMAALTALASPSGMH